VFSGLTYLQICVIDDAFFVIVPQIILRFLVNQNFKI